MKNSTRLFGKKTKQHWIDIRGNILENPKMYKNWEDAVELLELRLETRYFRPINKILRMRITSGEGFAVMTLICSLIEFLQSCYEGEMFDIEKARAGDKFYFGNGNSKAKFTEFLEQIEPFKLEFTKTHDSNSNPITDQKGTPIIDSQGNPITFASDFYSNVRCGLLHSAETKNDWEIKTHNKNSTPKSFVDLDNIREKIIYRDKFFQALEEYCKNYQQSIIKDENDQNRDSLRDNFCRKLDDLCGIYESDKTWWS